jgi:hypothetical protein
VCISKAVVRAIMENTFGFTDELITKLCKCIKLGHTYPTACEIIGIPFNEFVIWLNAGETGKEQKYIDFYNRIKSTKCEIKQARGMNSHQHTIILKSYCNREKEIEEYCKYLGRSPFELDEFDAAKMISELK